MALMASDPSTEEQTLYQFKPHDNAISQLLYDELDASKLYTSSYGKPSTNALLRWKDKGVTQAI